MNIVVNNIIATDMLAALIESYSKVTAQKETHHPWRNENGEINEIYFEPLPLTLEMKDWYKQADEWFLYLLNNVSQEVAVTLMNVAIRCPHKLPFSVMYMPNHKEFFRRNHDMFVGDGQ